MTLTPDRPLEVHLWPPVVQSHAEAQPVFRTYWNHYTRPRYFEAARGGARGPVLRVTKSHPYTLRTDDTFRVRFSATVGEEPEVELALD